MTATSEIKSLNEFIWKKYIDIESDCGAIEVDQASQAYEKYYAQHGYDEECYCYGILLFERYFQEGEEDDSLLIRAKEVLEAYQDITHEADWDVVVDRLEDINGILKERDIDVEALSQQLQHQRQRPIEIPGMIYVPPGEFMYGPDNESVFLNGFYIDIVPVTNREYAQFLSATNYRKPKFTDDRYLNHPDHPVVGIGYQDAARFATWADKELPTDMQWERAARFTDGRPYPWGGGLDFTKANFFYQGKADMTSPVGAFKAGVSPEGCYDLVGNVWEWTQTEDPEVSGAFFMRGGSWNDPPDQAFVSSHARISDDPKAKFNNLGFRLVKNV